MEIPCLSWKTRLKLSVNISSSLLSQNWESASKISKFLLCRKRHHIDKEIAFSEFSSKCEYNRNWVQYIHCCWWNLRRHIQLSNRNNIKGEPLISGSQCKIIVDQQNTTGCGWCIGSKTTHGWSHTNKKAFESNAKHALAERCIGYIMNKFKQVGAGAWPGGSHIGRRGWSGPGLGFPM